MTPGKRGVWTLAVFAWITGFGVVGAAAEEDLLAELAKRGEIVTVRWSDGPLPDSPDDQAWRQVGPSKIILYPQVSARPKNTRRETIAAAIKALYNEKELALYIEWPDARRSANRGVGEFADALAVQFPVHYGVGIPLPYVGMGDSGHPVGVWLWRADGSVETLAAEGFGSMDAQPSDGVHARGFWKEGVWRVVVKRTLEKPTADYAVEIIPSKQNLTPVAFAIWNGDEDQRDGSKLLSSWRFLRLERAKTDPGYVKSLVRAPRKKGDPKKGRALMEKEGCVDCHTYPGSKEKSEAGPDLSYAGGIHRPEYLLESLKKPSSIIVPGNYYFTMENGKKISIMPETDLSDSDVYHLLEYLKTLR